MEGNYTDQVDRLKQLEKEKRYDEAVTLYLECVEMIEKEAEQASDERHQIAPYYYRRLAVIYRKQKRYQDEIDILMRYCHHPNGNQWKKIQDFMERAEKAADLRDKLD